MLNSTEPILYLCDFTARLKNYNSGIQRVVRLLSNSLLDLGVPLVPVTLDNGVISVLSEEELLELSKYNGPSIEAWGSRDKLDTLLKMSNKIIVPELTTYIPDHDEYFSILQNNNLKIYYILYDLIPILFPQYYASNENLIRHSSYCESILKSDIVFPISNQSYSDLLNHIVIKKNKPINSIVPLLLPTDFPNMKTLPPKINSSNNINMLFVSTIEQRKNHKLLLEAYKEAKFKLKDLGVNLSLTLVGTSFHEDVMKNISDLIDELDVELIINASNEELAEKYEKADFTVYPSEYEGFGLPLVESFAFNRPVISSTGGSLKEVAHGGGALLFDPYDKDKLVSHIIKMSSKKVIRDTLVEEISKRTTKTWNQYAEEILYHINKK